MNKKQVLIIKDYVKCPQTGSKEYGKWGALNPRQRQLINELCDSWLLMYEEKTNELKKKKFEAEYNLGKACIYVNSIK